MFWNKNSKKKLWSSFSPWRSARRRSKNSRSLFFATLLFSPLSNESCLKALAAIFAKFFLKKMEVSRPLTEKVRLYDDCVGSLLVSQGPQYFISRNEAWIGQGFSCWAAEGRPNFFWALGPCAPPRNFEPNLSKSPAKRPRPVLGTQTTLVAFSDGKYLIKRAIWRKQIKKYFLHSSTGQFPDMEHFCVKFEKCRFLKFSTFFDHFDSRNVIVGHIFSHSWPKNQNSRRKTHNIRKCDQMFKQSGFLDWTVFWRVIRYIFNEKPPMWCQFWYPSSSAAIRDCRPKIRKKTTISGNGDQILKLAGFLDLQKWGFAYVKVPFKKTTRGTPSPAIYSCIWEPNGGI